MSIEKQYNKYILICDVDGEAHDEEYDTFSEAIDVKKELGWKSEMQNGEWVDMCKECKIEGLK